MESESQSEAGSEIASRLDELTDLFRRRLSHDRARAKAFDELYSRLEDAERVAQGELVMSLARDVIHVIDRIDTEIGTGRGSPFASSIADELSEALARQGIVEIDNESSFNPSIHEWIDEGTQGALRQFQPVRRGFRNHVRVIRPIGVVASDGAEETAEDDVV